MRILMIFHAAPYPPELGPARRHYHLLCEMLKRHEISVVSFGTPEQHLSFLRHFGSACRHVRFADNSLPRVLDTALRLLSTLFGRSAPRHAHTPKLQTVLDKLLKEARFDLIMCSNPFMVFYRLPANVLVISDTHNVEWLVLQRASRETGSLWRKIYYVLQARHTRREEIAAASRVDAVLTTSTCDMEVFQSDLPSQRFFVVPNGVDLPFYPAPKERPGPFTLLFTGLMSYYPNAHGIDWFLNDIFPRVRAAAPEVRLIIAGAKPSRALKARASDRIVVTGYVPDIRPYLARAAVFIVPLRIGGGTRVKILEAMAMLRPIVATTLACEGIDVVHGQSVLLADTAQAFADAVIRVLHDRNIRDLLAHNGHRLVRERYDWESIGVDVDGKLHEIAAVKERKSHKKAQNA